MLPQAGCLLHTHHRMRCSPVTDPALQVSTILLPQSQFALNMELASIASHRLYIIVEHMYSGATILSTWPSLRSALALSFLPLVAGLCSHTFQDVRK